MTLKSDLQKMISTLRVSEKPKKLKLKPQKSEMKKIHPKCLFFVALSADLCDCIVPQDEFGERTQHGNKRKGNKGQITWRWLCLEYFHTQRNRVCQWPQRDPTLFHFSVNVWWLKYPGWRLLCSTSAWKKKSYNSVVIYHYNVYSSYLNLTC